MNIRFDGRVVVVSGAGHGIGRAIAATFANLGAVVHACDLRPEPLAETARLTGAVPKLLDLTDRKAATAWIRDVEQTTGQAVHLLVNNAGGVAGQVMHPIEEISDEEWQVVFDVNVGAAMGLSRAVAPGMKRAGAGRIVNISSGAGLQA